MLKRAVVSLRCAVQRVQEWRWRTWRDCATSKPTRPARHVPSTDACAVVGHCRHRAAQASITGALVRPTGFTTRDAAGGRRGRRAGVVDGREAATVGLAVRARWCPRPGRQKKKRGLATPLRRFNWISGGRSRPRRTALRRRGELQQLASALRIRVRLVRDEIERASRPGVQRLTVGD
jgi:hypothetical protein